MSMPKTVDVIFGSQYTPIYERTDRQLKTNFVNAGFPDDAESLRYRLCLCAPVISNWSLSTQQTCETLRGRPTSPISDVLKQHCLLKLAPRRYIFLVSLDLRLLDRAIAYLMERSPA